MISSLVLLIARIIRLLVAIVVIIIVAAIVLRVAGANTSNSVVHDIHHLARTLVGPFHNLFSLHKKKVAIVVNWGIAAIVWLVVGFFVASLIARIALIGGGPRRRTV